jgi:hypothetical protein
MRQGAELRQVADQFGTKLEAYGLKRTPIKVESRTGDEWELPGWWTYVASWGRGRPKIGVWLDNSPERRQPFWFGFFGNVQKLVNGPWASVEYDTIDLTNYPEFSSWPHLEERLGRGFALERMDPGQDDGDYFGLYEFALKSSFTDETMLINEAATHIEELISLVDGTSVERDIRMVENDPNLEPRTRGQLIQARRGQGEYRRKLEIQWGGGCAVTGCTTSEALRASHIQPWHKSNNEEKVDGENGLLLVATLDALFDRGLIGFDDSGSVIISPAIDLDQWHRLGIDKTMKLRRELTSKQKVYLAGHRELRGLNHSN